MVWDVLKMISCDQEHSKVYSNQSHMIKYMMRYTKTISCDQIHGGLYSLQSCMHVIKYMETRGVLKTSLMWSSLSVTYGRPVVFSGFSSLQINEYTLLCSWSHEIILSTSHTMYLITWNLSEYTSPCTWLHKSTPHSYQLNFFFINGYIYFCTQFDLMWSSVWWEVYKKQYHVVKYIVYGEVYSKWSRDQVYAKIVYRNKYSH
jgi:hypothetical protein